MRNEAAAQYTRYLRFVIYDKNFLRRHVFIKLPLAKAGGQLISLIPDRHLKNYFGLVFVQAVSYPDFSTLRFHNTARDRKAETEPAAGRFVYIFTGSAREFIENLFAQICGYSAALV